MLASHAKPDAPLVLPAPDPLARHWELDPSVVFLNHGSFGACPTRVRAFQRELQDRAESEPVRFMVRDLEPLIDEARAELAAFVRCDTQGLAFVANASAGVSAILRSLCLEPGDELVTSAHEYNACNAAMEWVAGRSGAKVVQAPLPFPVRSADEAAQSVLSAVGPRTKLVMVSHVTSPTALVLPVEQIVADLRSRGVPVLVDGAHAPGMLPLDLAALDADYYVGNLHKWVCAPKGAGFLHAAERARQSLVPAVLSHGLNSTRTDRSRFHQMFDWTGTTDFTPWLCVPEALRTMEAMIPGGWPAIMERNRALALKARGLLCAALGVAPSAPDDMQGSMAAALLPAPVPGEPLVGPLGIDPLHERLSDRWRVQAPIMTIKTPAARLLRVSAQLYNSVEQYAYAARAIVAALHADR